MNLEILFALSNLIVLPFWILMIWLPQWTWTKKIVGSPFIVLPIAILFVINVIPIFDTVLAAFANPTFANFQAALGNPANAMGTWQHLLTVDLLAGFWVYHDGYGRNITRWLMTSALLLLVLLTPLGLIFYLLIRTFAMPK